MIDVAAVLEKREKNGAWSGSEAITLRVSLVRAGTAWLVRGIRDRDEEFADELLRQPAGDREQWLRDHHARLGQHLGRALHARALAFLNVGDFKAAADAAELARRISTLVGDQGGEALALGAAAYPAERLGPEASAKLIAESGAAAVAVSEPDVLARVWYDRARHVRTPNAARGVKAIEAYLVARKYAMRAEDPTILMRILYSLANIIVHAQSDYLTARQYIEEGTALARELGDAPGALSFEIVLTALYLGQGDMELGLFHHRRAMDLAEQQNAYAYPSLLMRYGCLLVDTGRHEEARQVFDRVLRRGRDGVEVKFGVAPSGSLASAARCMARIEAHHGRFGEAECLSREASDKAASNSHLFELAPYYFEAGNDAAALNAALASLGTDLYADSRGAALLVAARAYRNLGFEERALATALEAIELRESLDARIAGNEQQRASAARTTSEYYELAAELTLAGGDPTGALSLLERGRARVLMDIVEKGRPQLDTESTAEIREQQAALDREVNRLTQSLDRAVSRRDAGETRRLREELQRARALRASFDDGVRARADRAARARPDASRAGAADLARRVPPRTAVVEYLVGAHELSIFVAHGDGRVVVGKSRVDRDDALRRVDEFLRMLATGDLRVASRGRDLYSLLIAPVEKEIAGADALLVVPDDFLWRVPFAALVDARGAYLIERSAIVYAPSMTAYASMIDLGRRRPSQTVAVLAVGNPTIDTATSKAAASLYRDTTLGGLPEAEEEVDAIRNLYGPEHAVVLKRAAATEARTKSSLRTATIAHFATHAILDDANPMYSRLLLARDESSGDDGSLDAWEVARLNLDADLVVLSACDTARGAIGGGEGVIGLSWSFFLAGASSTVATQWKVASDSTARFMIAFHRALRSPYETPALHKAQSLREAQLQLIRDGRTRHPFHWAPFVLVGDPGVRRDENR